MPDSGSYNLETFQRERVLPAMGWWREQSPKGWWMPEHVRRVRCAILPRMRPA
jgi:hypothetical protein